MYNTDNETVRNLAAIESGVDFKTALRKMYLESWKQSLKEAERLLRYIISRKPHPVRSMLAIAECRQMILNLDQPLSEMISVIAEDMTIVYAAEKSNSQTGVQLVESAKIPLGCTHEVCTSTKCMIYIKEGSRRRTHYKCMQRDNPYISRDCTCDQCGREWKNHALITYETTFATGTDASRRRESKLFKVLLQQLQSEQLEIVQKRVQLSLFLKQNALLSHSETIDRYLEHFIENREASDKVTRKNLENVPSEIQTRSGRYSDE